MIYDHKQHASVALEGKEIGYDDTNGTVFIRDFVIADIP